MINESNEVYFQLSYYIKDRYRLVQVGLAPDGSSTYTSTPTYMTLFIDQAREIKPSSSLNQSLFTLKNCQSNYLFIHSLDDGRRWRQRFLQPHMLRISNVWQSTSRLQIPATLNKKKKKKNNSGSLRVITNSKFMTPLPAKPCVNALWFEERLKWWWHSLFYGKLTKWQGL